MGTKKTKVLLFGWEYHMESLMREDQLKEIDKHYEIIFAQYSNQAFDKVARAKLIDKTPIRAIVFKRSSIVVKREACKEIDKFASEYCDHNFVSICMIRNDQDVEARDNAVSNFFAKEEDWRQIQVILKNNVK